jgi:RNA polymerase subunit RPABC4/transcription elongation factor Spt4
MTENISNLIVAATSLCGAVVVALIAGITIWTFRDIRSRSRDVLVQILAPVMVAVIPIAGILIYFMLRPRETLAEQYVRALEEESLLASIENQEFCPTCGRRVDGDMQFCPSCHTKLRNACPNCGRAIHLSWDMCPYCGVQVTPEMPTVGKPAPKRVSAPNAPVIAPATVATAATAKTLETDTNKSGGVLNRMGGAIGSVKDRVAARVQQPQTDEKLYSDSSAETESDLPLANTNPPVAPSSRGNPDGNGSVPANEPKVKPKPTPNQEELE